MGGPIFKREGSQKYVHPPLFEQPLKFITHGCIFEVGVICLLVDCQCLLDSTVNCVSNQSIAAHYQ